MSENHSSVAPAAPAPAPVPLGYAAPSVSVNVRAVGLAQRMLMWAILANLLVTIASISISARPSGSALDAVGAVGILVAGIACRIFAMVAIYRMAASLDYSMVSRVLLILGMIVPLLNLILLLTLNAKATNCLKRAGIKVGLMGAKRADLMD